MDEIPRPAALRELRRCRFEAAHNCAALESDMFYYSYSLYSGVWKAGPKVEPPHKTWLQNTVLECEMTEKLLT